MSDGIVARLRAALEAPTDLGEALAGEWATLGPTELARRPLSLGNGKPAQVGDLFDVTGTAGGRIRFEGDLTKAKGLGAGLTQGEVVIEGDVGDDVGAGMAGGSIHVRGHAGDRPGGAAAEARRGMTGGELVIRGAAGADAGLRMRRGLLAIGGNAGDRAGAGMIAGTVVILGDAGASAGLWSKRGSVVALGAVAIPATYRYACTYRPPHLGLVLGRLRARYALPLNDRHLAGLYRRYSGDLADIGKGEILVWTAS
jgi:formylmethanofuran dehydrogenase subunit C